MCAAAADELAAQVTEQDLASGHLYPPLADLRAITRRIAAVVARAAVDAGVGIQLTDAGIEQALNREIWNLDDPTLRPV